MNRGRYRAYGNAFPSSTVLYKCIWERVPKLAFCAFIYYFVARAPGARLDCSDETLSHHNITSYTPYLFPVPALGLLFMVCSSPCTLFCSAIGLRLRFACVAEVLAHHASHLPHPAGLRSLCSVLPVRTFAASQTD